MSYSLETVKGTVYGKRDFEEVTKDLEIGRMSWITWVGPKCNPKDLCQGTQEESESEKLMKTESRDQSDAAISHDGKDPSLPLPAPPSLWREPLADILTLD